MANQRRKNKNRELAIGVDLAPNKASRTLEQPKFSPFRKDDPLFSPKNDTQTPTSDKFKKLLQFQANASTAQSSSLQCKAAYAEDDIPLSITAATSSPVFQQDSPSSSSTLRSPPMGGSSWSSPPPLRRLGRPPTMSYLDNEDQPTPKPPKAKISKKRTSYVELDLSSPPKEPSLALGRESPTSSFKRHRRPSDSVSVASGSLLPSFSNLSSNNDPPSISGADAFNRAIGLRKSSRATTKTPMLPSKDATKQSKESRSALGAKRMTDQQSILASDKHQLTKKLSSTSTASNDACLEPLKRTRRAKGSTTILRPKSPIELGTSSPDKPSPPKKPKRSLATTSSSASITNEEAQSIADRFAATQMSTEPKARLCSFCDCEISKQTPNSIVRLLEQLRQKYSHQHRPTLANPKHIEVPLLERAALCTSHSQWSHEIPRGQAKGWPGPGEIDFGQLTLRLNRHKKCLKDLASGKTTSAFYQSALEDIGRAGNVSLATEFISFDKEMPGYYGPKGLEIIFPHLAELLFHKPKYLQPALTKPLDPNQFIRRILVPEAGVLLVQEDLKCSRSAAIETVVESRLYGMAINGSDDD